MPPSANSDEVALNNQRVLEILCGNGAVLLIEHLNDEILNNILKETYRIIKPVVGLPLQHRMMKTWQSLKRSARIAAASIFLSAYALVVAGCFARLYGSDPVS